MRKLGRTALILAAGAALSVTLVICIGADDRSDRPLTRMEMTRTFGAVCVPCTEIQTKSCADLPPKGRCVDRENATPECTYYYEQTTEIYHACNDLAGKPKCFNDGRKLCYKAWEAENEAVIEQRKCASQVAGCVEIAATYNCRLCRKGATRVTSEDIYKDDQDCRVPM